MLSSVLGLSLSPCSLLSLFFSFQSLIVDSLAVSIAVRKKKKREREGKMHVIFFSKIKKIDHWSSSRPPYGNQRIRPVQIIQILICWKSSTVTHKITKAFLDENSLLQDVVIQDFSLSLHLSLMHH
jgi:hypothetical protein